MQVTPPAPQRPRTPRWQIVLAAVTVVLTALVVAAIATGVVLPRSNAPQASPTQSRSASAGTSTSPAPKPSATKTVAAKEVAYPTFHAPMTYQLLQPPQMYRIEYQAGIIDLASKPGEFQIGFRIDRAHSDRSELLADNERYSTSQGHRMVPINVDGGSGFKTEHDYKGKKIIFYVFARGPITITLTLASADGQIPEERRAAAEKLIQTMRFDDTTLTGRYRGKPPEPVTPFTYEMPDTFRTAESYRTKLASRYQVSLLYRPDQKITLTLDIHPEEKGAVDAYRGRKEKVDSNSVVRSGKVKVLDVKTAGSTADNVGKEVDEGLGFITKAKGGERIVFFVFRKGEKVLYLNADGGDVPIPANELEAATGIVGSLKFPDE